MSQVESKGKTADVIRDFIIENFLFGNKDNMISSSESFMENGIIDSLGIMELIEFCEETFDIKIQDDELIPENLDSLSNINEFVSMKQEKQ